MEAQLSLSVKELDQLISWGVIEDVEHGLEDAGQALMDKLVAARTRLS